MIHSQIVMGQILIFFLVFAGSDALIQTGHLNWAIVLVILYLGSEGILWLLKKSFK
jgi:hypothetical protein